MHGEQQNLQSKYSPSIRGPSLTSFLSECTISLDYNSSRANSPSINGLEMPKAHHVSVLVDGVFPSVPSPSCR